MGATGNDAGETPPRAVLGPGVRFAAVGGLALAYGMAVPLKVQGLLPSTVTWAGVGLIPAFFFGAVFLVALPVRTAREGRMRAALGLICLAAGYLAVYLQGWH